MTQFKKLSNSSLLIAYSEFSKLSPEDLETFDGTQPKEAILEELFERFEPLISSCTFIGRRKGINARDLEQQAYVGLTMTVEQITEKLRAGDDDRLEHFPGLAKQVIRRQLQHVFGGYFSAVSMPSGRTTQIKARMQKLESDGVAQGAIVDQVTSDFEVSRSVAEAVYATCTTTVPYDHSESMDDDLGPGSSASVPGTQLDDLIKRDEITAQAAWLRSSLSEVSPVEKEVILLLYGLDPAVSDPDEKATLARVAEILNARGHRTSTGRMLCKAAVIRARDRAMHVLRKSARHHKIVEAAA